MMEKQQELQLQISIFINFKCLQITKMAYETINRSNKVNNSSTDC